MISKISSVIIFAIIFIPLNLQTSNAEVSDFNGEEFVYVNSDNYTERYIVTKLEGEWRFFEVDLEFPANISPAPMPTLIVESVGLTFRYDRELVEEGKWSFHGCDFSVLRTIPRYTLSSEKKYVDILQIEAQCTNPSIASQYTYSEEFGIQSFSIGEMKKINGKWEYEKDRSYYLEAKEIGFGALVVSRK